MNENILDGLVRIGKVTDVSGKKVRVYFPDLDMTSGWLYCLQRRGSITVDGQSVQIPAWVPQINDIVACLYLPVENGDGFILGGVQ